MTALRLIAILALELVLAPAWAAEYCEVVYPQGVQAQETESRISARVALGIHARINPDDALRRVERAARGMQAEFQRLGMDVEVDGFRIDADCSGGFNGSCFSALRALAPEHTHLHVWADTSPGLCGRASLGGTTAWTSIACGLETLLHEQGHNFRLGHSGEGDWQYGWRTWMGAGSGRAEYNAQNVGVMRHAIRAEGPGGYLLTSVYTPDYPGETHLVQAGDYFASLWRGRLAVSRNDPKSSRSGSWTWLLATVRKGETVRVGGHDFYFSDSHRGAASVAVGAAKPPAQWSEPESGGGTPVSGLWSSPNTSHQGMLIYRHSGGLNAYWMTWADDESPRWYLVQGTPDSLEIWRTKADLRGRELIRAGTGQIRFEDGHAVFDYWIDERQRGRLDLEQLTQAVDGHPLAGHWALGGLTGLVTQVTPDGTLFGFWLRYDIDGSVGARGPQQQWLMVFGDESGRLRVHEPRHGRHAVRVKSDLIGWGDADLQADRLTWSGREMGQTEATRIF